MHDKQLFGTATVGTKGQVVIPADAREALSIKTGDRLYVVGSKSKEWVGFIKEEQLREMLEHLTNNIEQYKDILNKYKDSLKTSAMIMEIKMDFQIYFRNMIANNNIYKDLYKFYFEQGIPSD